MPDSGFNTNAVAAGILSLPGSLEGSGNTLLLNPQENNTFRVMNNAKDEGLAVIFDPETQSYGIRNASRTLMQEWVDDYAVNGVLTSNDSKTNVSARIAVYDPWRASMDMGWSRWLIDNFGFKYSRIRNADFINGKQGERFDVILIASERSGFIEKGFEKGMAPPQYAGGLTNQGIRNLNAFVDDGGTLICLNKSSDFAIEAMQLPVKNERKMSSEAIFLQEALF